MANPCDHDLLFLDAAAIARLLTPRLCRDAIEDAYRALHAAPSDQPRSIGFKTARGKIHVKAGLMPGAGRYFAAKINANYPENMRAFGLPTVQGVIALFSTENGRPLAILQSGALTALRTAATAALAAQYGAKAKSSCLALIGAGAQARYMVDAMADLFPMTTLAVFDLDRGRAEALAQWSAGRFNKARVAASPEGAFAGCDIAVTITPAAAPFVRLGMIPKGAFVAAVGADNPDKNEIAAEVFAEARVCADDPDVCAADGDLAHAIRAGTARKDSVVGLAEIVAGAARARRSEDEIVLFDSTGSGLQDVAATAAVYEAAGQAGEGQRIRLE